MRAWIVAVLLFGCSKKDERTGSGSQPAVKAPQAVDAADAAASGDCAKRAGRLERDLHELAAKRPGFVPIVQGIGAPSASGAQPIKERGWVIAVARDGSMFVQGHRFEKTAHTTQIEDVRNFTEAMFRSAAEAIVMEGGSSLDVSIPLYVWADREAPARVVAELVAYADPDAPWPPRPGDKHKPSHDPPPPDDEDGAAARKQAIQAARKAGILGKPAEARPSPSHMPMRLLVVPEGATPGAVASAAKLPPLEPESTNKVVQELKAAMGDGCGPLITAIAVTSLGGVPTKDADKLAREVAAGLVSCECKLPDVNAFEAAVRTWFGDWAPSLWWVAMPKLDLNDKRTLGQVLAR